MMGAVAAASIVLQVVGAIVIRQFDQQLTGVRANSASVTLSVTQEPSLGNERVLVVEYPEPGANPAARDVQCTAEHTDWSGSRGIAFQVKSERPSRMSVSFIDRNHVVYTAYVDLKGGEWQAVQIAFDSIKPNRFFQPPDAKAGSPLDVSDVRFIAFAPQDKVSGRLMVTAFRLER
jgi:hypothetical protein